jgi:hypothetical protein
LKVALTFDRPADNSLLSVSVIDLMTQSSVVKTGILSLSNTPNSDLKQIDRAFLNIVKNDNPAAKHYLPINIYGSVEREKVIACVDVRCFPCLISSFL